MPKIAVDVNDLFTEYDEETDTVVPVDLRELVIREAASQLVKQYGREAQTAIGHIINDVVTTEIRKVVQTAMGQPIQRTTQWGEPIGDTTTILEVVRGKIDEFVTAKPARREEFGRQRTEANNLGELVEDTVRKMLTQELAGAVKKAREHVATTAQQVLAEMLPKALAR
jgi:hypothetical protein